MLRLSSNITLMLRVAIPIIYASFGAIFIIVMFISEIDIFYFSMTYFRGGVLICYILFLWIIYKTLWRLRRVEYHEEKLYVSSYYKNVRYDIRDVERITEKGFGFFRIEKIILNNKGIWGSSIIFIPKKSNLQEFKNSFPHLFA